MFKHCFISVHSLSKFNRAFEVEDTANEMDAACSVCVASQVWLAIGRILGIVLSEWDTNNATKIFCGNIIAHSFLTNSSPVVFDTPAICF